MNRHEFEKKRKTQGKFKDLEFFIRFVKSWDDIEGDNRFKYGYYSYLTIGKATIEAKILNDDEFYFTPCFYDVNDINVQILYVSLPTILKGRFFPHRPIVFTDEMSFVDSSGARGSLWASQTQVVHECRRTCPGMESQNGSGVTQKGSWANLLQTHGGAASVSHHPVRACREQHVLEPSLELFPSVAVGIQKRFEPFQRLHASPLVLACHPWIQSEPRVVSNRAVKGVLC